jgi:hypothetical protein
MEFIRTFFAKLNQKPRADLVVQKKDREVQRYVKQNQLTKSRQEFEKAMRLDKENEE